ncbi:MAG: hypothetical protein ACERKV_00100 [Clostridiaceae bacterium]
MTFILFILFIIILFFMYTYYNNKSYKTKLKMMCLIRENDALSNKLTKINKNTQSISIKYESFDISSGKINKNCDLLICPIINSPKLTIIKKNFKVDILDCAEIFNKKWYFVKLPSEYTINNKGWIISDNILLQENKTV